MGDKRVQMNAQGEVATRLTSGTLRVWESNGVMYCSGIGKMYAKKGFPIARSLDRCVVKGMIPALSSVVVEMIEAGSDRDTAIKRVFEGLDDMTEKVPDSWADVIAFLNQNFKKETTDAG